MEKALKFLAETLLTKKFWLLLLANFTMVLMAEWRSDLRNEIYQSAAETVGKRFN